MESAMGNKKKFQIVFVAAEVYPWSVTGGLGVVMGGLPAAMAAVGHRVMTISPRWDQYGDTWDTCHTETIPIGNHTHNVRYFHCYKEKVDRVFVDHPIFLERVWGCTNRQFYGPHWGADWSDNEFAMTLFNHSSIAAVKNLSCGGYPFGEDVILVCNDWHTGLIPPLIAKERRATGSQAWSSTRVCVLIHNLVYQGRFPYSDETAKALGMDEKMVKDMLITQSLRVGSTDEPIQVINWLKGAITNADQVVTVSPTYAQEVSMSSVKGAELNELLRSHKGGYCDGVVGILNGIISAGHTLTNYTLDEARELKSHRKRLIQRQLGLEVTDKAPLFLFIGRLDYQKGVDIMLETLSDAAEQYPSAQFCIVGSGQEPLTNDRSEVVSKNSNVRADETFKGPDKYDYYCAADFVLLPSRFEPCGLVQMEAMYHGAVPIVTPTGGFADTVHEKTGIILKEELCPQLVVRAKDVEVLHTGIINAINIYENTPATMASMQAAGLEKARMDFSWTHAVKQYTDVFDALTRQPGVVAA